MGGKEEASTWCWQPWWLRCYLSTDLLKRTSREQKHSDLHVRLFASGSFFYFPPSPPNERFKALHVGPLSSSDDDLAFNFAVLHLTPHLERWHEGSGCSARPSFRTEISHRAIKEEKMWGILESRRSLFLQVRVRTKQFYSVLFFTRLSALFLSLIFLHSLILYKWKGEGWATISSLKETYMVGQKFRITYLDLHIWDQNSKLKEDVLSIIQQVLLC